MFAKKITCPFVVCATVLISNQSFAQLSTVPKWEAGVHVGTYLYQGDLTPHAIGSLETIRPGFALSGTRILNRLFSVRMMFSMASLAGNESVYKFPAYRQQRNLAFNASVKELAVTFHWTVLGTNYDDVKWEPYVFAGAGASFVNVSRDYSRVNYEYFGENSQVQRGVAEDAVTPTPRVLMVIPAGAGIRYHLSKRFVLNLEGTYRFMHNDYLDGFSQAANPKLGDHYNSVTAGISYKFGNKEKYGCPAVN